MSLMGEKDGRPLPHGRVGATTRLPARRAATGSAPARAPRVVAGHSPIGPANGRAGSIQREAVAGISAQPIMRPSPPHFVGRPKTESTTFRRAAQESRRLRRVARLPPHPEPAARAAGRPRRCAGGPLPAPRHADGAQGGGVLTCSSNLRSQPVANSGCIPARPHRQCIFGGGGRPHRPTAATGAVGPASPARWGRGKERSAGRLRPQSLGVSVCPTGELRWRHLPPLCVQRRCGHVAGARARGGLAAGTHQADG